METLGERIARIRLLEMMGRGRELAAVLDWLVEGDETILWVVGEGGVGKTTLLRAVAEHSFSRWGWGTNWLDFRREGAGPLLDSKHQGPLAELLPGDQQRLWIIDSFENAPPAIAGNLAAVIPGLQADDRIVVVTRRLPIDGQVSGRVVAVKPFQEEMTLLFWRERGLEPDSAKRAHYLSGGNPLLLTLLASAVARGGSEVLDTGLGISAEADLIMHSIVEASDFEVLLVLEAASLLPSFNPDILQAVLGAKYITHSFTRMAELPFITSAGDWWQMHELVGQVLAANLRREAPQDYRRYRRAAFQYYVKLAGQYPELAEAMWLNCVYLCDSVTARQMLFSGFTLERAGAELPVALPEEMDQISECWKDNSFLFPEVTDYQLLPEYHDLHNLLALGNHYFRVVRGADGTVAGYHATLPVCAETMNYLCSAPAMREYFSRLDPVEINRLRSLSPETTDTYVIRHLIIKTGGESAYIMAKLLRDILQICYRRPRLITSTPSSQYYQLATGLGFWPVPGVYDRGFPLPNPVLVLDLRKLELEAWLEWLVLGPEAPLWLASLVQMPPEQWSREVRSALANMQDLVRLGASPLAPVAAAVLGGINVTLVTHPPEVLGEFLRAWLVQMVDRMQQADETGASRGLTLAELGKALELTYLMPGNTRSAVASLLQLSEPTYYRRLRQAWEKLAALLQEDTKALYHASL